MISLVTITFAWLYLATVNTVSDIKVTAIKNVDLLLSVDGINYYEELPGELILANMQKLKLTDITSQDGINFQKLDQSDFAPIVNQDYMEFKLYFKTYDRRYREVHLANHLKNISFNEKSDGTYVTSIGKDFEAEYDYYYSENELITAGTTKTHYASEAIRVSFISDDLEESKIFDLSNNPERGFGYEYGALDYYLKKEGVQLIPPQAPTVITEMSEMANSSPTALNDTSFLITLEDDDNNGYYTGSVTVRIWLEGWDGDAFDAIYEDKIIIQFEFTGKIPNNESNNKGEIENE